MELYSKVAYKHSKSLTLAYSTSFGISSYLFSKSIRRHIYAIYGLVRIADEIVDTYKGPDAEKVLDELEKEVYEAIARRYSVNPIVQAFAETAADYGISKTLIEPFFKSMRIDLTPQAYDDSLYQAYIYGSAEVVGLMCLRVFCGGDDSQYDTLKKGATALGSAYQKVNFLRDVAADYHELGRIYFPGITFDTLDEAAKQAIIADCQADFATAIEALRSLPSASRVATMNSYIYYRALLDKLAATPIEVIKSQRVRLSGFQKTALLLKVIIIESWRR